MVHLNSVAIECTQHSCAGPDCHRMGPTMKKASTELATKSLPDNQIMTWECASWHA